MMKILRSIFARVENDGRAETLKTELDQEVRRRAVAADNEVRHVEALGAIVTGLHEQIAQEHHR